MGSCGPTEASSLGQADVAVSSVRGEDEGSCSHREAFLKLDLP